MKDVIHPFFMFIPWMYFMMGNLKNDIKIVRFLGSAGLGLEKKVKNSILGGKKFCLIALAYI